MKLRLLSSSSLLVVASVLAIPTSVEAQGLGQVMMGMRDGGGLVGIPIEGGRGTFSSTTIPTGAMSVAGCVNVW